jgi:hypothetical protein
MRPLVRDGRTLASLCIAHGANMLIHVADCLANLQIFCREKSGNGVPNSVCLCLLHVRGRGGHSWHARPGTMGRRSNTLCPLSYTVVICGWLYGGVTQRRLG